MQITPTKKQMEFLSWELGVFFHFGIRTFYEGHKDWDMQPMSLEGFIPQSLSCEQWIKTIHEAGAKYAVFVAKHHDGFANWPSKYTQYSVANTPWKDGKGDVVAEFVSACRQYDIKVGIYYSPAEFDMKDAKKTDKQYDDYFINQIAELLTGYGKIDYLWFDGCGSEGHVYDTVRIIGKIRQMQPELLIFNMWDPDTRWIGNEDGFAPLPNFNIVDSVDFSVLSNERDIMQEKLYLPGECDCRLRWKNWFYSGHDANTIKTLDQLMGLYYLSVGRGANLLINIGPDRRGLLPAEDAQRILEFGSEIKRRFSNPVAVGKFAKKSIDHKYFLALDDFTLINHLILKEDISFGDGVLKYRILIKTSGTRKYVTVFEGANIGHKAICQFPAVHTNEVVVEILEAENDYGITEIKAFYVQ